MLSLGGERPPPPPPIPPHYPPKQKFWIITCTTIWVCYHYYGVFFAHLPILEYPDHHQNLISSSLYYPGPLHKLSSKSIHNLLSNVHRQTKWQTNTTKNITSFAKEVRNRPLELDQSTSVKLNLCSLILKTYHFYTHKWHILIIYRFNYNK